MGGLFGGSKQSSTSNSYNQFAGQLNNTFSPLTANAATGANALGALLGGDPTGFNAYKQATGFDDAAKLGSQGITGNAAAAGMLRSGSTDKALQSFGNTIQNQYANNYMDKLLSQAGLGLQAGQLISGAGQVGQSKFSGSSKPGLGGLIGGIAGGIARSDRRAKKNIHKVGDGWGGLKIYQYRYLDNSGPFIGVMADEVATLHPEALGPVIDGYMTVDYSKLKEIDSGTTV